MNSTNRIHIKPYQAPLADGATVTKSDGKGNSQGRRFGSLSLQIAQVRGKYTQNLNCRGTPHRELASPHQDLAFSHRDLGVLHRDLSAGRSDEERPARINSTNSGRI